MGLQVEKLEKNMAKLTIEVSAEELEKAIDRAYHKNKGKISIPGFRKGKVPRQMIEKMYGKEMFYEDAANELIGTAYEKALDECEEDIVSSPTITVTQIESGKPFIFTAEVALKPEVKLGKYKGVKVPAADLEVTEEEVNESIERERERSARTIAVEDRAVKDGDVTTLDFEGFVDGEAFEGGKGENYPLTIGSGAFIPGFEEQLIGTEIGKEVEVNVTFPEEYQAKELAGKAAVFKCTIREIKEKQLPDLDDEFASEVSEFDTLEEYREDVKKNLAERKERTARDAKEEAAVQAVVDDSDLEIPEAMLETQQRQMLDEFTQRINMQGMSLEQYFQFTGTNRTAMLEQLKPQAETRIKSRLVLEAVAAKEGIEATAEDVEEELKVMGEAYQMELEQVKELLDDRAMKQLREDLIIRKAAEFVVENAKEDKPKKKAAAKTTSEKSAKTTKTTKTSKTTKTTKTTKAAKAEKTEEPEKTEQET